MKMTQLIGCSINVWSGDDYIILDVKRGDEKMLFEVHIGEAEALLDSIQRAVSKARGTV